MLSADDLVQRHSRVEACNAVVGVILENINRQIMLAHSSGNSSTTYEFSLLFEIPSVPQSEARQIILAEVIDTLQQKGYSVKLRGQYESDILVYLKIGWVTESDKRRMQRQKLILAKASAAQWQGRP